MKSEDIRALAEYLLAAICVIAAVVVFISVDGKPESEAAMMGIAGAAIGAVLRGRG